MKNIYSLLIGFCFIGSVHAQIVNIPDANFKERLLSGNNNYIIASDLSGLSLKIDANNDGEIQVSEAQNVKGLELLYSNILPISSLEGISSFTNLTTLTCIDNPLTSLNVKSLVNLTYLHCSRDKLTSLDVSGMVNLTYLNCGQNYLTSLDVTSLVNLVSLGCNDNQINSLNLIPLVNLTGLYCYKTNLTSLVIKYTKLGIDDNFSLSKFNFSDNTKLQYICANEKQLIAVQNRIYQFKYTNCHVNSYCSFNPGETYYTIQGNTKFDSNNNNGCDVSDINFPNLKFFITDGTIIGNIVSNTSGNYSLPVVEGTYAITPTLENPNYYTISSSSINVAFPTQTSPFTQDFCITPNGNHQDLEVTLLPINRARPGFDASYKIIYKNKGTITQSGSVKLTFDDSVLDLVATNPVFTSQSIDNLTWDYLDLKPFETRAIEVTLNVNSPMETPAVNINDRLSFTALINPVDGDEQPVDNSFALRQLVVGSYDPNDKTCLEGSTIAPSAVGKYVHYLIRFENKGTAEAENVVVKDMIDTSKFDISSLVVTEGSHPFVTKISDTNKVEFIFEKINLPFDDATNDGYVAFKIKTKPSLVLGDSFSNTASIYFDYNFPIITNTATTSVLQSLGTQDFEFDSYFSVFPNPAKQLLNIDVKKQIELTSISIFNTLGQQILVIPNAQQTKQVDVSSLQTGNYFIKVSSNKGSASGKFIKN
ncbi:T9SS type A sorting domain-containing protein [Flavobacterium luteum]|uniref:T9SS type A sorting domain-containing protein n=1 Tax=Flavobacterium luteum TaxID=2026654 RepID=A0A7J5AKG3_9FLAO|nr:T9SS type A sorting domain-containing protein [Flavobacterium luteum]KAB1158066.1 T9SS type A sorting domain-containing protein [Flavobacterium luteum]